MTLDDLAAVAHEAWCAEKRKDGFHLRAECRAITATRHGDKKYCWGCSTSWSYDAEPACTCKVRGPCSFCRTDLIPYADLPERAKEYDRAVVRAVLAKVVSACADVARSSQESCFCADGEHPCNACFEAARIEGAIRGIVAGLEKS